MTFWWKRYEPLLEQKAVPATEVLKDLMAKELCEICESFPPEPAQVVWEDPRQKARFAEALPDLPRVDLAQVELLAEILTKDLGHEPEAIDHLFRNERHKAACPTPAHEEALHFLWPLMVEVLLSRKEEVSGALKNRDLLDVVERFAGKYKERRMLLM